MIYALILMSAAVLCLAIAYTFSFRALRELTAYIGILSDQVSEISDFLTGPPSPEPTDNNLDFAEMSRFSSGISNVLSYEVSPQKSLMI